MNELRKESYNHPENNTPNWIECQIIANHVYDMPTFEQYIQVRGCQPTDSSGDAVLKGFVEIPIKERHFCFEFKRDQSEIDRMHQRVIDCRKYINEYLFKQI